MIAACARAVLERRKVLCNERQTGLTALYNDLDEGAFEDLSVLHLDLDRAVAAAYGWPAHIAQRTAEMNARLRELNSEIHQGVRTYTLY